jgi:hypothetical protein
LDELVAETESLGHIHGNIALVPRIARALGGDGDRPVAELLAGDDGQVCAVNASAERDEAGIEVAKDLPETAFLEVPV